MTVSGLQNCCFSQSEIVRFFFYESWCLSKVNLSPLLFVIVMDDLTDVKDVSLMELLSADGVALCGESFDEVIGSCKR